MKLIQIQSACLVMAVLFLASCGGGKKVVGRPAPETTPPVPLADILSSPAEYDGQTVVLRGILTGQCGSLCDFTYAERGESVNVFMDDLKAPRIRPGQPVRVTAKVHSGERQAVFTAVGLEILPRTPSQ